MLVLGTYVRILPFLVPSWSPKSKVKCTLLLNFIVKVHLCSSCLPAKINLYYSGRILFYPGFWPFIFCCSWGFDFKSDGHSPQDLHEILHLGGSAAEGGGSENCLYTHVISIFLGTSPRPAPKVANGKAASSSSGSSSSSDDDSEEEKAVAISKKV